MIKNDELQVIVKTDISMKTLSFMELKIRVHWTFLFFFFRKRPSDQFTVRVILDLGINTEPTADDQLKNTLLDNIRQNRRIGRYEALEDEFKFFKFDGKELFFPWEVVEFLLW